MKINNKLILTIFLFILPIICFGAGTSILSYNWSNVISSTFDTILMTSTNPLKNYNLPLSSITPPSPYMNANVSRLPPLGFQSYPAVASGVNELWITNTVYQIRTNNARNFGFKYVMMDDGEWNVGRDSNGNIFLNTNKFNFPLKWYADYCHSNNCLFGVYYAVGSTTINGDPISSPGNNQWGLGHWEQDATNIVGANVDFIRVVYDSGDYPNGYSGSYPFMKRFINAVQSTGRPVLIQATTHNWEPWMAYSINVNLNYEVENGRYAPTNLYQYPLTSLVHNGVTATATLSSNPFKDGDIIFITQTGGTAASLYFTNSADILGLHLGFVVSNATVTTFQYNMTNTPASDPAGGTTFTAEAGGFIADPNGLPRNLVLYCDILLGNVTPFSRPGFFPHVGGFLPSLQFGNITNAQAWMTINSMLSSPLFFADPLSLFSSTYPNTFTNALMLAINQDSLVSPAKRLYITNGVDVLIKPLSDGSYAVSLYNRTITNAVATVSWGDIGLPIGDAIVIDIWNGTTNVSSGPLVRTVKSKGDGSWNEVGFYKITPINKQPLLYTYNYFSLPLNSAIPYPFGPSVVNNLLDAGSELANGYSVNGLSVLKIAFDDDGHKGGAWEIPREKIIGTNITLISTFFQKANTAPTSYGIRAQWSDMTGASSGNSALIYDTYVSGQWFTPSNGVSVPFFVTNTFTIPSQNCQLFVWIGRGGISSSVSTNSFYFLGQAAMIH